ncbi:hypothetical protein [Coleofasciculus sp. FACHB-SPT9]|uniref:hypothetical protein n=1 Tax=Cyanophyceae TaxID=3028117 RepID=UPI001683D5F3|nr:hypothetical protein [Coleofasciculus sp. FACHB-SPT9]MBD1893057.1 hypothetical protein [Coleofasciculus sp. FACHB-SPT9]
MHDDHLYQEVSHLSHVAELSAVLNPVRHYCQNRAANQRSEGESSQHRLNLVEVLAVITEDWDDE